eukprot:scaffold2802_cov110-Isochrysis_galbana.AAC.8
MSRRPPGWRQARRWRRASVIDSGGSAERVKMERARSANGSVGRQAGGGWVRSHSTAWARCVSASRASLSFTSAIARPDTSQPSTRADGSSARSGSMALPAPHPVSRTVIGSALSRAWGCRQGNSLYK